MLIIRLVRSRPYISLEDLVREVECAMAYYDDEGTAGVSRRTVLRDIGDIRSGLGVSIEYSRSEGGYYIPEDEDRISDLERVLEQFDLITSLRAREELSSIVFAEKRKAAGTEHLSPLIYAVKKHLEVEFTYVKYDGSEPRQRRVMPYALKEGQGRWYLLAIVWMWRRISRIRSACIPTAMCRLRKLSCRCLPERAATARPILSTNHRKC